jgi:putative mannan endo-1,4-beta-mannosidase 5
VAQGTAVSTTAGNGTSASKQAIGAEATDRTTTRHTSNTQATRPTAVPEEPTDTNNPLVAQYLEPLLDRKVTFQAQGFSQFITVKDSRLYEGNTPYRFMAFNQPSALINMDAGRDDKMLRMSAYEMEDLMKTAVQMGAQCIRVHHIPVATAGIPEIRYIYGPGQYDELMFRDMDLLLAYANKYKIRLIIPFIVTYDETGAPDFDRLCGGNGTLDSFWKNANTRARFKEFLTYLLNRTNTYTGVKYKDDKAILCWQLGNELNHPIISKPKSEGGLGDTPVTDEWVREMAAHVKSIDKNHLVANGGQYDPSPAVLNDPNIDIISMHYCTPLGFGGTPDSIDKITLDQFKQSGKAYIHDEFDTFSVNKNFLDGIVNNPLISGAAVWRIRTHDKNGGYQWHQDFDAPDLRWPGYSNGMDDERGRMTLLRETAYRIRSAGVPALPKPDAPTLLPITTLSEIRFRGSAGADNYILERADSPNGPWRVISDNVADNQSPFFSPYADTKSDSDKPGFYRLTAENRAGKSAPSNIIPYGGNEFLYVDMEEETLNGQLVDEFNSLARLWKVTNEGAVSIVTSRDDNQYNTAALSFTGKTELIYKTASDIQDVFLSIGWKNSDWKTIGLLVSADGKTFTKLSADLVDYGQADGQHFGRLEKFPLQKGYRYLKITVDAASSLEINRLEVNLA